MPRTQIAKKNIHDDHSGVTINFTEGEPLVVTLETLSPEIITHLALHGLSQKLGDSYSGESDIAVARAKAVGVGERLREGDWKSIREGGGSRISDLAQALANIQQRPIEDAVAVISNMEKADKKGLRAHPKIAAELARITAERAQKKADEAAEKGEGEGTFDLGSL